MREFEVVDLGFFAESIFILVEVRGVLGTAMEFFGIVPMVVFSLPDEVLLFPRPLTAETAVLVFSVTIALLLL